MEQLKDEINKSLETLHDITKWKLIIVAVMSATALGLAEGTGGKMRCDLLLLVPFVCSYSDLAFYQNLIRIYVIAKFLRERTPETPAEGVIQEYENFSETVRETTGAFNLDQYAQLGSSILFSVGVPAITMINVAQETTSPYVVAGRWTAWAIGVLLVIILYINFRRKEKFVDTVRPEPGKRPS